jgi:hypothetical protein
MYWSISASSRFNPVVLDRVGQAAEAVELVLETAGQDAIDLLVLSVVVNEVQHVHRAAGLAKPLDPAKPLLEA